jgi:hypothetical protein
LVGRVVETADVAGGSSRAPLFQRAPCC